MNKLDIQPCCYEARQNIKDKQSKVLTVLTSGLLGEHVVSQHGFVSLRILFLLERDQGLRLCGHRVGLSVLSAINSSLFKSIQCSKSILDFSVSQCELGCVTVVKEKPQNWSAHLHLVVNQMRLPQILRLI